MAKTEAFPIGDEVASSVKEPAAKRKKPLPKTSGGWEGESGIPAEDDFASESAIGPSDPTGNRDSPLESTLAIVGSKTGVETRIEGENDKSSRARISSSHNLPQRQHRSTSERRRLFNGHQGGIGDMNPRRILTGIYGSRGESVRRTVYDGALRVNDDAYHVVREALADFFPWNGIYGIDDGFSNACMMTPPLLNARPEWRKLLPTVALMRPSTDSSLGSHMIATELSKSDIEEKGTLAVNRNIPIWTTQASLERGTALETRGETGENVSQEEGLTLRIRGGGTDDDGMQPPPSVEESDNSMVCSLRYNADDEGAIDDVTSLSTENPGPSVITGVSNHSVAASAGDDGLTYLNTKYNRDVESGIDAGSGASSANAISGEIGELES